MMEEHEADEDNRTTAELYLDFAKQDLSTVILMLRVISLNQVDGCDSLTPARITRIQDVRDLVTRALELLRQ